MSDLNLTWYGNACIFLESGDQSIIFDPFSGLPIGALSDPHFVPVYADVFRRASAVLVTHGHFDHIMQIPAIYRGMDTPIYCTRTPCQSLRDMGVPEENLRQIAPGFTADLGDFHITAWQGRHCKFDGPLIAETILRKGFFRHPAHLLGLLAADLRFQENGEILFYEIAWQGSRIQIMGSMNLDDRTDYPTDADLLILPLQGRSDQDEYALQFVRRLRPRAILLDHCDDAFPPMSQDVDVSGFVRNVQSRYAIPCFTIPKGKTCCLSSLKQGEELSRRTAASSVPQSVGHGDYARRGLAAFARNK